MKRALLPSLNPTGLGSAAAAIYAAVVMIWNGAHHHGVIDPQVIVAALGAAAFLYARFKVTPVADPRDGNGQPLAPAATAPPVTVNMSTATADAAEIGRQITAAVRGYKRRAGDYTAASGPPEPAAPPPGPAGASMPPAAAEQPPPAAAGPGGTP